MNGPEHVERWHRAYETGRRWGDEPGELARLAPEWLSDQGAGPSWRLLDVGCGYGRDAVFLAREAGIRVVGIDPAVAGIELARTSAPEDLSDASRPGGPRLEYRCCAVEDVHDGPYDAVFVSNVYHILPAEGRAALRGRALALLRPGGLLLLSTLAVGDPEHYGSATAKGTPSRAPDSHLYFSTEDSVRAEFAGFEILRLRRHEFVEPQTQGPDHHHLHVVLLARRPAEG